jgi:cytochrome b
MVTATGIAIDKGQSLGVSNLEVVAPASADDDSKIQELDKQESYLEESHEFFANMLALFVGLHVTYLLLFKRPLAQFMLFVTKKEPRKIKEEE